MTRKKAGTLAIVGDVAMLKLRAALAKQYVSVNRLPCVGNVVAPDPELVSGLAPTELMFFSVPRNVRSEGISAWAGVPKVLRPGQDLPKAVAATARV